MTTQKQLVLEGKCSYKSLENGACDNGDDCLNELFCVGADAGNKTCKSSDDINVECAGDNDLCSGFDERLTCRDNQCQPKDNSCDADDNDDCLGDNNLCHNQACYLNCNNNDDCEDLVCRLIADASNVCQVKAEPRDDFEVNVNYAHACDENADCANGSICHRDICRTSDKLICTDEDQCDGYTTENDVNPELTRCRVNAADDDTRTCKSAGQVGNICDAGQNDDCAGNLICYELAGTHTCQNPDTLPCAENNNDACIAHSGDLTCIADTCAPKPNAEDACDQGDHDDCSDLVCHQSVCKVSTELNCANNDDCGEYQAVFGKAPNQTTCRENLCKTVGAAEETCDSITPDHGDDSDCGENLICHKGNDNQFTCVSNINLECQSNAQCSNRDDTPVCRPNAENSICLAKAAISNENTNGSLVNIPSYCDGNADCAEGVCHLNVIRGKGICRDNANRICDDSTQCSDDEHCSPKVVDGEAVIFDGTIINVCSPKRGEDEICQSGQHNQCLPNLRCFTANDADRTGLCKDLFDYCNPSFNFDDGVPPREADELNGCNEVSKFSSPLQGQSADCFAERKTFTAKNTCSAAACSGNDFVNEATNRCENPIIACGINDGAIFTKRIIWSNGNNSFVCGEDLNQFEYYANIEASRSGEEVLTNKQALSGYPGDSENPANRFDCSSANKVPSADRRSCQDIPVNNVFDSESNSYVEMEISKYYPRYPSNEGAADCAAGTFRKTFGLGAHVSCMPGLDFCNKDNDDDVYEWDLVSSIFPIKPRRCRQSGNLLHLSKYAR